MNLIPINRALTAYLLIAWPMIHAGAQDLLRGPYLQSVAQESVKILWRTEQAVQGWVELYEPSGDSSVLLYRENSAARDHILLADGLKPGTVYQYRIGHDSTYLTPNEPRFRIRTSSDDIDTLSFWVTGDFGAANQDQINTRNAFIGHVNGNFPDFWLWLGDNAYGRGTDEEYQERVFTPPYGYDSLLTFLPFFPVPGNHDYGSVNMFHPPEKHRGPYYDIVEVPQEGEAGGLPSNTELYYSFDYGNAHFVGLNSEAFAYTFFKRSAMEAWLRKDLAQTDKMWKVVFWHQPPYSKGSHDSDDFWEVFMKAMREHYNPIVEEYGVDLVLCGHSHVYERSHLIKGHYGRSSSFRPEMFVDKEPPYEKFLDGDNANSGTMYIVQGNSGKDEADPEFGHPVFAAESGGQHVCGSLVVKIAGRELKGAHIRSDGVVVDEFRIIKSNR